MIVVRRATPEDVPFVVELGAILHARSGLENRGLGFNPIVAHENAERWIARPDVSTILLAELAGLPVGGIGLVMSPLYFGSAMVATSCFWGQLNEVRGLGVARALLAGAEQWARERGATHLTFLVLPNREQNKVIAALRRRDFEQVETAWTRRL